MKINKLNYLILERQIDKNIIIFYFYDNLS